MLLQIIRLTAVLMWCFNKWDDGATHWLQYHVWDFGGVITHFQGRIRTFDQWLITDFGGAILNLAILMCYNKFWRYRTLTRSGALTVSGIVITEHWKPHVTFGLGKRWNVLHCPLLFCLYDVWLFLKFCTGFFLIVINCSLGSCCCFIRSCWGQKLLLRPWKPEWCVKKAKTDLGFSLLHCVIFSHWFTKWKRG